MKGSTAGRIALAVAQVVIAGCYGGRVIELTLARSATYEMRTLQERAVMECLDAVARDLGRVVKELPMASGEARTYAAQEPGGGPDGFLVSVSMEKRIRVFFRSGPLEDPELGERAMQVCRAELDRSGLPYEVRRDSNPLASGAPVDGLAPDRRDIDRTPGSSVVASYWHDSIGNEVEWVKRNWTANPEAQHVGPLGAVYALVGTHLFSVMGGLDGERYP